MLIVIHVTWH